MNPSRLRINSLLATRNFVQLVQELTNILWRLQHEILLMIELMLVVVSYNVRADNRVEMRKQVRITVFDNIFKLKTTQKDPLGYIEYVNEYSCQNIITIFKIRERQRIYVSVIKRTQNDLIYKLGWVHEPIKEYPAIAISISSEEAQLELNSISSTNKFLISLRLKLNLMQN